jgi:translocation and assembly module TamB
LLAFDYSVALESPVGLQVSQTLATLDEFTIVGDHDVRLSGTASWSDAEGARISADLGAVPLNLVNTFVETGLTFDQSVTGELALRVDPDGKPTGRGDIAMTPGTVVGTDDPDVAFSTGEARIGFNLDGEGLRAGVLDIPLPGQGQIAAEFDVTDAERGRPGDINSTIDVDLADIGVLATLDEFHIVGDHDVRLSGTASWSAAEGAVVATNLGAVPLNLINTFVETGLTFDQSVTGQLSLRIDQDGEPTGRADIAMTPGSVIDTDNPDVLFSTGEARLGFDLNGEGLRSGIIDIPLPGQGQIAAKFDVTDGGPERPGVIDSTIDVDLADIGVLAALFPFIDDATGSLYIDLIVSGSVDNPSMRGDVALQRGALVYLPIGLVLNDIEVTSELRDDGEIELTGSFRAGDGVGRISTRTGRAQRAANGVELTLAGDNLLLIDVPDVRAVANTDLQIAFDGRALNIDGVLDIPSARIRPSNLGTSKVYESEDVIIVAGELPEELVADADAGASAIQVFGNLKTSLGDDVIVDLDVAEADISGAVDLTWSGDLIPMAEGRLTIDGEILAFGQRLDITEGQIRFPRGPVDDPYLRLRAEREIFGNTQVRRAGLLVAGSLKRPTIEAYTNPMTTEERALTLLVTGSDFDLEQGVGSVDFGTYIAPRVFVSYGIGLFDTENVIRVRYDLTRGFGITGTSGERDSGLDLSYRFEN